MNRQHTRRATYLLIFMICDLFCYQKSKYAWYIGIQLKTALRSLALKIFII